MGIFFLDYAPHSLVEWGFQKKDTHTLDFDVTLMGTVGGDIQRGCIWAR
ncbi:MAG: hypothetical protein JRJ77_07890 [Deltaproteobacteria bacterium]|nr:hypothetical protein [Deltaproteobacteria bacterium]